jgi:hypothetical protein
MDESLSLEHGNITPTHLPSAFLATQKSLKGCHGSLIKHNEGLQEGWSGYQEQSHHSG